MDDRYELEQPPPLKPRRTRCRRARRWHVGLLALLGWLLASPQSGAAQTLSAPAACASAPKLARKYDNGLSAGTQRADAIFAAADVARKPSKLQKKLNRVLDRLYEQVRDLWEAERGEGRRCRVQGFADGFLGRLAQHLGGCVLDGAEWGQFAANLYCDLSVELGGLGEPTPFLRAPVGLCGTLFEQVCDDAYAFVATGGADPVASGVAHFLRQRGVTLTPYPACAPYTEGAFAATFAENLERDCAY